MKSKYHFYCYEACAHASYYRRPRNPSPSVSDSENEDSNKENKNQPSASVGPVRKRARRGNQVVSELGRLIDAHVGEQEKELVQSRQRQEQHNEMLTNTLDKIANCLTTMTADREREREILAEQREADRKNTLELFKAVIPQASQSKDNW